MTDWQPIETAPKDGTKILLGGTQYPNTEQDITRIGRWYHTGYSVPDNGTFILDVGNNTRIEGTFPTHWMPLPEPPR